MQMSRREFLGMSIAPVVATAALGSGRALASAMEAANGATGTARQLARDEDFWFEIAQAFTVDRSIVNLNNGGVSPAPAWVQEAQKRHLDVANSLPPPHALWRVQQKQAEGVRQRLGRTFGVDAEEIAITRNASEGLQILQFGFDLEPGDEVLCNSQDYPRMINTFRQRERREGIRLVQFPLPVPTDDPTEVVRLYEEHITPRTRMILVSHVVFVTGAVLPVGEIVAMARRYNGGIPVLIDGAHALAHLDFKIGDLACDYYATSLHKWLFAPHGTGLLYVRRERIPGVWPLMAASETQDDDIRKFEEIGTHPFAQTLAIGEALTFYESIGAERKAARMRHLREYWTDRLLAHDRVVLLTPTGEGRSCGIATFAVEGVDPGRLAGHLWNEHRILVTSVDYGEMDGRGGVRGVRVSPSVYTTRDELDRFCDAVGVVIREGLPS